MKRDSRDQLEEAEESTTFGGVDFLFSHLYE